jgi:hypothetical protein
MPRRGLTPEQKLAIKQQLETKVTKGVLVTETARQQLQTKLQKRQIVQPKITPKVVRKPTNVRLVREDQIERQVAKVQSETGAKVDSLAQSLNQVAGSVAELASDVQEQIAALADYITATLKAHLDSLPQVKDGIDGHTPTADELKQALQPTLNESKKDFLERIAKIERLIANLPKPETIVKETVIRPEVIVNETVVRSESKPSEIPQTLEELAEFVRQNTPKQRPIFGGGGGPGYFFELLDTPNKSAGYQGAYSDYKDKYLKVSSDGKRLEWATVSGGSDTPTFEKVSKNLASVDYALNYTGDNLTSLVYTNGITKTLNYTGDNLTSVVLSGSTPSGIDLTKTLVYTGDDLTGVVYS